MEKTLITVKPQAAVFDSEIQIYRKSSLHSINLMNPSFSHSKLTFGSICMNCKKSLKIKNQASGISIYEELMKLSKNYQVLWKQVEIIEKENQNLNLKNRKLKEIISQISEKSIIKTKFQSQNQGTSIYLNQTKKQISNDISTFENQSIHKKDNNLEDSNIYQPSSNYQQLKLNTIDFTKIDFIESTIPKQDQQSFVKRQKKFPEPIKMNDQSLIQKDQVIKRLNKTVEQLAEEIKTLKNIIKKRQDIQDNRHRQLQKIQIILKDF